jgi:O-succinylbenzoate synthase
MDVASVKPARIGGVLAAARAASRCAGAGVPCFVGGMFELGIGRAAALAVASLDACDLPTDLGPSHRYVADDVCEPLRTDGSGAVVVPSGAGFGRVPGPLPEPARVVARAVLTAGA